ncbi:MAG TPA: MFS transporter [Spirochaetia bacterium]|nr:MFS transporter [Spirochaetia bacterium]
MKILTRRGRTASAEGFVFSILAAISISHLLNDTIQSLIPATYPLLKDSLALTYAQIGLVTLTFQLAASIFQPLVGAFTDRRRQPYSLAVGMTFSLAGLLLLSRASSFPAVLLSVALVGIGSSVFHPESARVANMAAGARRGLAQSFFQVGGNLGSSLGPLLAALIIVPYGQRAIVWFSLAALAAIAVLTVVGGWYKRNHVRTDAAQRSREPREGAGLPRRIVGWSVVILLLLIFSKFFYLASMTSYYIFYLIAKFKFSVADAQLHLFIFLLSVAVGTLVGGPLGDRFGRKYIIWISILGATPFTLALPYAGPLLTMILTIIIGVVLASAFPAILVYAQELLPGKLGMISGMFYGFAFGMGGLGSAVLGVLADKTSIIFVYKLCSFLPLVGLITAFLPNLASSRPRRGTSEAPRV